MFCDNCGALLKDNALFCTNCGARSQPDPNDKTESVFNKTESIYDKTVPMQPPILPVSSKTAYTQPFTWQELESERQAPAKERGNKRHTCIFITAGAVLFAAAAFVVCLLTGIISFSAKNDAQTADELIALGEKYLRDLDYKQAELTFESLIDIDPKNPRGYTGLAEAYLGQDKPSKALKVLEEGLSELSDDEEFLVDAEGIYHDIIRDSHDYSSAYTGLASVYMALREEAMAEKTLREGLNEIPDSTAIRDMLHEITGDSDAASDTDGGDTTGGSESGPAAPETSDAEPARSPTVPITTAPVPTPTPIPEDATVELISTDFSDYPDVRAYFRIRDASSGLAIPDLMTDYFIIRERIQGGDYLYREVIYAGILKNAGGRTGGISFDLVADKSDSISYSDMNKIKKVMKEFCANLQFSAGDSAEIIAFDDVVQQMCTYTDNIDHLRTGIENMSTDGSTAFYDAVYTGVRNASLRSGARCVIAFTDGLDNRSSYTPTSVINYANAQQVPLYLIGIGSADEGTLRQMAYETNGRYWYIDDLYDLSEIYLQIYSELQDMYVVEYRSDSSAPTDSQRDLFVEVDGGGYKGEQVSAFIPAKTAARPAGASRYEIYVMDVTWEEANRLCLEMGGHLATITSEEECRQLIALAESNGASYVWLGGYTSNDDYGNVFGHWITGEAFEYSMWCEGEPSRVDRDGTPEWYLMLWNIEHLGGWSWNDQRNDPIPASKSISGKLAFICEFE